MSDKSKWLIGAALIFIALPASAQSQDSATASVSEVSDKDEIVVTATRRKLTLSDVPAGVSALGEDQLLDIGARDIQGYVLNVPGVSFFDSDEELGQTITIRGISDQRGSSTTAFYLDEMPIPADLRLFDVDRVEVLRGPQGTLFGISTMGGVLRFIPRLPNTSKVEAILEVAGSQTRFADGLNSNLSAALNIPLIRDRLALRLVGYRDDERGTVDVFRADFDVAQDTTVTTNELLATGAGRVVTTGGRAALLFDAGEGTQIFLNLAHQETRREGFETEDRAIFPIGSRQQAREFVEESDDIYSLANITIRHQTDYGELTAVSSYARRKTSNSFAAANALGDLVTLTNDLAPDFGFAPFILGDFDGVPLFNQAVTKTFTNEVRFASDLGGPFQFLLGGFYSDASTEGDQQIFVTPSSAVTLPDGLIELSDFPFDNTVEYALFGEISLNATDRLKLTAGLRKYWLEFDNISIPGGFWGEFFAALDEVPLEPSIGASRENGEVFKFDASYDFGDILAYARVASGYRPGGTNATSQSNALATIPAGFETDRLTQYELGLRFGGFGGRLRGAAAVYYSDWKELQGLVSDPVTSNLFTDNFGDAATRGAELELGYQITPALEIGGAYSYTKATFESDVPVRRITKGDPIPNIPEHQFNLYASIVKPIATDVDSYFRGDLSHVGTRPNIRGEVGELDPYTLLNLRAGVRWRGVDFSLFAENLLNDEAVISRRFGGTRVAYITPRTVGVRVRVQL